MRISVVVAAYNAAPWIGATLRSVATQSHAADEVIVVDDGSTDATAAIAVAHGARVVAIPNGGVSAARNRGIEEARNDWIALLDADDLWHVDKLARQVAAAVLAPDVAVVACDHYQFADDGRLLLPSALDARRDRYRSVAPQRIAPTVCRLTDMGCGLITLGQVLFPSTLLVRRDLVHRVGGFDPAFRRCEDYEFLLRALAHSDVALVEEPLMGYRKHAEGISRNDEAMALALVALGWQLAAHPERYAPDAHVRFRPCLRGSLMCLARMAMKDHDYRRARAMLDAAGRIHRGVDWAALYAASRLPRTALAGLLNLKRQAEWRV